MIIFLFYLFVIYGNFLVKVKGGKKKNFSKCLRYVRMWILVGFIKFMSMIRSRKDNSKEFAYLEWLKKMNIYIIEVVVCEKRIKLINMILNLN